jgi:hypothetical protein
MKPQEKLDHLFILKAQIESFPFQEFLVKPMKEEMEKLRNAYDCESLRELATTKGKKQGLLFLLNTLKNIDMDIKNLKHEIENS